MYIKVLLLALITTQFNCYAEPLTLMSFNIRYDTSKDGENRWELRKEHVAEVIREQKPDVIAIQEAVSSQMKFLRDEFKNLIPIGEHTGGNNREFSGLFIEKSKFELLDSGQIWLSETPHKKGSVGWDASLSRSAIWAKLKLRDSESNPFVVFGTHFDHRGKEARIESAKLLIEHIESLNNVTPVVVMGDLNCEPNSKPMKVFFQSGFSTAIPRVDGGTFHAFKGNEDGSHIDFILLNKHWSVESAEILRPRRDGKSASDHDPVIARVEEENKLDANRRLHFQRTGYWNPKWGPKPSIASNIDNWGKTTSSKAEIYAAVDVEDSQIDLTKKWYEIASNAWGNYGPLEFWLVGHSEEAAAKLDEEYCALRNQKSPSVPIDACLSRDHNFVTYAKEGNAGLNLRRNEHEEWFGFIITMTCKNPSPREDDYKPVLLHEYFHVYQQAHIYTKNQSERELLSQKNPWWLEGGAEYMAQLLYSKQKGVRGGYLKEVMQRKLNSIKDLKEGQRIDQIPYGPDARVAYDLGAWFIAFLISKTSEEDYRIGFFKDLNDKGFEGSFRKNFGVSSTDLLNEFHSKFLDLPASEKMKVIP